MAVYVDECQLHHNAWGPFKRGSCHLTADTAEELHAFAARLGLKREWFQPHRVADHYDLTPGKRELAVKLGAVFVPMREQIIRRRKANSEGGR